MDRALYVYTDTWNRWGIVRFSSKAHRGTSTCHFGEPWTNHESDGCYGTGFRSSEIEGRIVGNSVTTKRLMAANGMFRPYPTPPEIAKLLRVSQANDARRNPNRTLRCGVRGDARRGPLTRAQGVPVISEVNQSSSQLRGYGTPCPKKAQDKKNENDTGRFLRPTRRLSLYVMA